MKNSSRQIVKIIKEICAENHIPLKLYSCDWVMQLEINKMNVFIYGYQFQNNNAAAQLICDDKSALSEILVNNGINAVEHHFFMTPTDMKYVGADGNWKKIIKLLADYGAIVCKNNTGTGGNNVYKAVNQYELENAVFAVFKSSRALAVCKYYEIAEEYRAIILNGVTEVVYKKEIPFVTGDGVHKFWELCGEKYSISAINNIYSNVQYDEIIPKDSVVKLNWKHNLGKGASAAVITDEILKRELSELAAAAANATNISFASVDIIKTGNEYKILEINSGIMMENFAGSGEENYIIAKSIYKKALGLF